MEGNGMRWEYLRLSIYNGSHPIQWTKLGEERWELVAIYDSMAYFKRPIEPVKFTGLKASITTGHEQNYGYDTIQDGYRIYDRRTLVNLSGWEVIKLLNGD